MKMSRQIKVILAVVAMLVLLVAVVRLAPEPVLEKAHFENIKTVEDLRQHSREFIKRVENVTDGVYVAIGFGLANSIMIVGDDGVIIVDTMESVEAATNVRNAFKQITQKPVKAIIYTHGHSDHVFGASAFTDGRQIPVYAHVTTINYINFITDILRPIINKRSMRMFGNFLDDNGLVNAGIGPRLKINEDSVFGIVRPTHTFEDTLTVEIAGIRFTLVHAPGETSDHIFIYLPDKKVLLPGDNIYKAFPNLYTIRGTRYRDVIKWVQSLDKMRALRPAYLVPSHTGPISGSEKIYKILTDYRDAIQFVHDQTIRGMNMGLTPDELVATIHLPPHLAKSPFLQEFYGTVEWSVRGIFEGNLGWFDGNPTSLFPLSPLEYAQQMATLAGGETKLQNHAETAFYDKQYQWVLELTDHLLRLNPANQEAIDLRVKALITLGENQRNPSARNYFLTSAAELGQGLVVRRLGNITREVVHCLPMSDFFDVLAVNLDAEKSANMNLIVGFIFPDSGENYTVHVRRGVAEIQPRLMENLDLTVTVPSTIWKEMLANFRNPIITIATDFDIEGEGGKIRFLRFMALFTPEHEE